jgi:hypothetical protein
MPLQGGGSSHSLSRPQAAWLVGGGRRQHPASGCGCGEGAVHRAAQRGAVVRSAALLLQRAWLDDLEDACTGWWPLNMHPPCCLHPLPPWHHLVHMAGMHGPCDWCIDACAKLARDRVVGAPPAGAAGQPVRLAAAQQPPMLAGTCWLARPAGCIDGSGPSPSKWFWNGGVC